MVVKIITFSHFMAQGRGEWQGTEAMINVIYAFIWVFVILLVIELGSIFR